MKQYLNKIPIIVALLMLTSLGARAEQTVIKVVKPDASAGTLSHSIADGVCQLTVTPAEGYYIAEVTAKTTLDGSGVQVRRRGIDFKSESLVVNSAGTNTDPSKACIYTLEMPKDESINVEVTATFQTRTDISTATVETTETSFVFTGEAIEPAVKVTFEGNVIEAADYTVEYADNINAGTNTGKITVKGARKYNGEATGTFTISKATPTLAFSDGSPTAKLGWEFTPPTLTTTPADLTDITYGTSNSDAATVDENTGAITLIGLGETTITAVFPGNSNYEANEASYLLTVTEGEKDEPTFSFSATTATATYGDETVETPTLSNPDNFKVTYESSNPDVATVDASGAVAIVGAGETTISASFKGDYYYTAKTVSYTLTVNKAKPTLTYSETSVEIKATDEFTAPTLTITPSDLEGITYSSSDTKVATVDGSGAVTLLEPGTTVIKATFAGNDNYEKAEASYTLTVKKGDGFDLWVGGVQVTKKNYKDVLGNGNVFFFDPNSNMLIISDNTTPVAIESRLPMLTIFLNGTNSLECIFFNNNGKAENTGSLAITSYGNIPGKLDLSTGAPGGVISGFSSVSIDTDAGLHVMEPANGYYDETSQVFVDEEGNVAYAASIGQPIQPLAEGSVVDFPSDNFVQKDENGNNADVPLSNTAIDDVLYTLGNGDGYDTTDGTIVMNNPILPEDVYVLGQRVESGELLPGSSEYAEAFEGGITFMVPDGTGSIILEVETEPGYKLMLQIGTNPPVEIQEQTMKKVEIEYDVPKPTYIFLYLAKDNAAPAAARNSNHRIGKRETAHVRLNSMQVQPKKPASSNPLSGVDEIPDNTIQEVVITGIVTIPAVRAVNSDRWYTIEGRQIEKPTRKGLYIQNGKKYVIQ